MSKYFLSGMFAATVVAIAPQNLWAEQAVTADSTQQRAPDSLEVIANHFFPVRAMRGMVIGSCETGYRTKLNRTPADIEVEKAIPGIHAEMVSASSSYCRKEVELWIVSSHAEIKSFWKKSVTESQLAQIAAFLRKFNADVDAYNVEFREGDMATDAAARAPGASQAQKADWARQQAVFAKQPDGVLLLNKLAAYQGEILKRYGSVETGPARIVANGMIQAHRAANAYAKAKGFEALYDDAE